MAIELEDIIVKFGADVAEIKEAFDTVEESASTLDFALKAIGIGFVINEVMELTGAILGYVDASAEATAITDSYASRLGIATDKMIDLQTAAAQFGVEQEEVNEGIKNMSERIADAYINQTGAAFDALDSLGLSLDNIVQMGADEQFLAVADALSNVEDEAQRTFLSMEIGQEEFFRMNELIALGSDGIRGLIQETQNLNADLAASDFENIRGMQVAAGNAQTAFDSIIQQLTADLAPSLERVNQIAAEWFASFRDEGLPIIEEFLGNAIDGFLEFSEDTLPNILTVGSAVWEGLMLGIDALWTIASQIFGFISTGWGLLFEEVTGENNWIDFITENLSIAAKTWPEIISNVFLTIGSFISGVLSKVVSTFTKITDDITETALGVQFQLGLINEEELDEAIDQLSKEQQARDKQGNFFDQLRAAQEATIAENNREIDKAAQEVIDDREKNQKNISDLISRLTTTTPEQLERLRNAERRAQARGGRRGGTEQRDNLKAAQEARKASEEFNAVTAGTTEAFKIFNRATIEAPAQNQIEKAQQETTKAIVDNTKAVVGVLESIVPGLKGTLKQINVTTQSA